MVDTCRAAAAEEYAPEAREPAGYHHSDASLKEQVRGVLGNDLKIEPDLGRWFPVWGAPGL